jgi:hypothetical protein
MSPRLLRCALVILVLFAAPRPAHADMMGFWRWWDSLSGPGPFNGYAADIPLYTVYRPADRIQIEFDPFEDAALANPSSIKVGLQFGVLKAEDNNLPYAAGRTPPGVWAIPISVTADRRIVRGVDVGAGVGLVRFFGEGFGLTRATVSPRLSVAPASLLSDGPATRRTEAFKIRLFFTALLGEFDAGDFGATGDFKGGNELLFGTTFTIDVLALKR